MTTGDGPERIPSDLLHGESIVNDLFTFESDLEREGSTSTHLRVSEIPITWQDSTFAKIMII